jgi:2-haloacid dehalogenase
MNIKTVIFDAYGTLFDVYSIGVLADSLYPNHGGAISNLWRDKQIEYTRLITMSDPHQAQGSRYYQSFWDITRSALLYTLERFNLDMRPEHIDALMDQYAKLTPFAENLGVLQSLKERGITTAILSNGSPVMLANALASAGMNNLIDHVISVDSIRIFKTSPEAYSLVQQIISAEKQDILFVSSNGWDALGATWFGFTTLWVNRQNLPFETIGPRPNFTSSSLEAVMDIVKV